MAVPPRRACSLLLVVVVALALAAAIVFSYADATRVLPKALEAVQDASAADVQRQAQAATGSRDDDALPVEHVVVVDKRGGGGHGGGGHGGGEGEGEGSSRGFGGAGYHGYGTGPRGFESASSGRADGVWKVGVAASVLGAVAWLL